VLADDVVRVVLPSAGAAASISFTGAPTTAGDDVKKGPSPKKNIADGPEQAVGAALAALGLAHEAIMFQRLFTKSPDEPVPTANELLRDAVGSYRQATTGAQSDTAGGVHAPSSPLGLPSGSSTKESTDRDSSVKRDSSQTPANFDGSARSTINTADTSNVGSPWTNAPTSSVSSTGAGAGFSGTRSVVLSRKRRTSTHFDPDALLLEAPTVAAADGALVVGRPNNSGAPPAAPALQITQEVVLSMEAAPSTAASPAIMLHQDVYRRTTLVVRGTQLDQLRGLQALQKQEADIGASVYRQLTQGRSASVTPASVTLQRASDWTV
jgi:hypothetical protein